MNIKDNQIDYKQIELALRNLKIPFGSYYCMGWPADYWCIEISKEDKICEYNAKDTSISFYCQTGNLKNFISTITPINTEDCINKIAEWYFDSIIAVKMMQQLLILEVPYNYNRKTKLLTISKRHETISFDFSYSRIVYQEFLNISFFTNLQECLSVALRWYYEDA